MLLAAVVNSIRSVDSEEMRGEIERMKGSDALTEAILEFGKVCSEVRCAVHMGSHQLSSRVFCVYLVICECSWWLQPADTTATAVRDAPPPPAPQEFPGLVRPLLHERDEYLAYMLRKLPAHGCTVVVAVVGAGHLQGIRWVGGSVGGGWVHACLQASMHVLADRKSGGTPLRDTLVPCVFMLLIACRDNWEQEIDIAAISSMPVPPQQHSAWRWRRLALLATGGVLVSSALVRYSLRRR